MTTVPDEFVAAMVKVLTAWDWAQRPAGVITLPSRTRPLLIAASASGSPGSAGCPTWAPWSTPPDRWRWRPRSRRASRRPPGGTTSPPAEDGRPAETAPRRTAAWPRTARQYNSAHRLRALWDSLAVPEQLGGAVAGLGGPVLLVDDRLETGWTMTVAARLLRETGAAAVLPLVLAVTTG